MKSSIIYNREERYASFPHVVVAAGGQLLLVFREAGAETARAALDEVHTHQDRDSRIMLMRSHDGGGSWTEPRVIYEGEFAVNNPALTVLPEGRCLLRFGRWRLAQRAQRRSLAGTVMRHNVRTGQVGVMAGSGFMLSPDMGTTWYSMPSRVDDPSLMHAMTREPVTPLADGTLLLPVYEGYPFQSESVWILRSWNEGYNWGDATLLAGGYSSNRPYRSSPNYNETALLSLDVMTILAVVRVEGGFVNERGALISEGGVGELGWTISNDAGFTWEPLQATGLWGQPAHLLRLKDGRMLCTFGYRRPPCGIRAALFTIEGGKWRTTHQIVLREDGLGWDIGYPVSTQLANGEILTVYYFYGEDRLRHIAATRWRSEEMIELQEI